MNSTGDSSALIAATNWVEQALAGSAATMLASIALAGVGLLFMTGRIDLRRAGTIVLGCFMIFSAASIAHGLLASADGGARGASIAEAPAALPPSYAKAPSANSPKKQAMLDPYAAAAVPQQ